MSVDQKMSVSIGSSDFQIVVEDSDVARQLLSELHGWSVDNVPGPGFRLVEPKSKRGLWVSLGADGSPIARSRDLAAATQVLRRHLDALIGATEDDFSARFGLRAVVSNAAGVLIDPTLLRAQPVVERRFASSSIRIVDSPYVDVLVGLKEITLRPVPRSGFASDTQVPGHTLNADDGTRVEALLWNGTDGLAAPTVAQTAHALAGTTRTGSRNERVELSLELADRIPVVLVDRQTKSSVFRAVNRVLKGG